MFDERGACVWAGELDIFGDMQVRLGARDDCPFRWPGQYEDVETGLYYNRHRYYDPRSGLYISPDPLGLEGGRALYAYPIDPLVLVDPLGLNVSTGAGRDSVTYQGIKDGKPYTGYASAPSSLGLDPERIVSRRYGGDFSAFGGVRPKPVYSGSDEQGKETARGLEQHYYEQDVKMHGKQGVANKQNPVGPRNKKRDKYKKAADAHLKGCS
ncbi:MAG: RHS repeat-associated core domain-containing protein [Deltaproteobacteria bacterium]|nr:RHS repeat-associated core domain-containing protein [Deltaproteobacteria bacterium]